MKPLATLILFLSLISGAFAEVTVPRIIADHMILQRDAVVTIWGWADEGEKVAVAVAGQKKEATADKDGSWLVKLDPMKASSEGRTLTIVGKNTVTIKDVLIGEVWLAAGQSNMVSGIRQVPGDERSVYTAQKTNDLVRLFLNGGKDPELHAGDSPGSWMRHSQDTLGTSAVGFFFALKLQRELNVPVGYIVVARCGSIIEPFIPAEEYESAQLQGKKNSGIFNSSIEPLTSYAIKGAIWYQGESNRGSSNYFECVKALSAGWSRAFDIPNIPLHQVQVAPFDYTRKGQTNSLLCDNVWAPQQRAAREIKGVGVVAIHDTDINVTKIHPRRKKPVAERLAALALKNQYGKGVITSGPVFAKATIRDAKVIISFDLIDEGLTTKDGKPPTCFELSEDGKVFMTANASIKDDQVLLSSDTVTTPKFVRMGWYETSIPNLKDKNGWPAFAFPASNIEQEQK
jgi:sialate O-acetylesterase